MKFIKKCVKYSSQERFTLDESDAVPVFYAVGKIQIVLRMTDRLWELMVLFRIQGETWHSNVVQTFLNS